MLLDSLHLKKHFKRHRESSWNREGKNGDYVRIGPGQTFDIPRLMGPGIIRHLWMTMPPQFADVYQKMQLIMTFDDAQTPQVCMPVADFFMFGHGELVDVNSGPIQVSQQPECLNPAWFGKPYRGSLNCTFPMPFAHSAKVQIRNTSDEHIGVYFYVDWEAHESLPDPVLHFHANLNEARPALPEDQPVQDHGKFDGALANLTSQNNYTFLNISGYEGHYVGTALSIDCKPDDNGKWWEGDDMFIIDDEQWPPRLHGTGTEDYFNLAWGIRAVDCRPEYGVTFVDKSCCEEGADQIDGRFTMYRFHLNDPIPFEKSIHASVEHGHANDCNALYRSVAYWYGRPL
ncbi:MAG: glycoside hydrolase family 172 protein [Phycisphaeraceae bacterium JB051]